VVPVYFYYCEQNALLEENSSSEVDFEISLCSDFFILIVHCAAILKREKSKIIVLIRYKSDLYKDIYGRLIKVSVRLWTFF